MVLGVLVMMCLIFVMVFFIFRVGLVSMIFVLNVLSSMWCFFDIDVGIVRMMW